MEKPENRSEDEAQEGDAGAAAAQPEEEGTAHAADPGAGDSTEAGAGNANGEDDGEGPLKICRHCSVASRTEADDCPACGKPYARVINWKIPGAIAIIAIAFFIGFFGRMILDDGDDGNASAITVEQASAVEVGSSRAEVVEALDTEPLDTGPAPLSDADAAVDAAVDECLFYSIADTEDVVWEYCFVGDELLISDRVDL
ncbi:MAG: hypothetical protein ACR2N5_02195 [Solirubrobacterales bacterium]